MSSSVAPVLERWSRYASVGVRFWDAASGSQQIDGLVVDIVDPAVPSRRVRARPNRSGVYVAVDVPGLRGFEFGRAASPDGYADDEADFAMARRPFRVEVRDPLGRFLSTRWDTGLPKRGTLGRPLLSLSPATPLRLPTEAGRPAALVADAIPLLSAPTRQPPAALAVVRAQLRVAGSAQPAAGALLTARIDGVACGFGAADEEGRVLLCFAYPERTRPAPTSPPAQRNDFAWNLELQAHFQPPALRDEAPRDLCELLTQLSHPAQLLQSIATPPQPLGLLPLGYASPLTLRSAVSPLELSAYLYLSRP